MTLPELARQLEPVTDEALESSNPDILAVATILAAILGCIAEGQIDHEALRPLVLTAGAICEHRTGLHIDALRQAVESLRKSHEIIGEMLRIRADLPRGV